MAVVGDGAYEFTNSLWRSLTQMCFTLPQMQLASSHFEVQYFTTVSAFLAQTFTFILTKYLGFTGVPFLNSIGNSVSTHTYTLVLY